ncbi:MAG: helix-turn-helix domain-containing protein [Lachnospiraceae bacterium]|nr:helix-turn-helix domain-containing protein [Lachnospiraceae bacterium]
MGKELGDHAKDRKNTSKNTIDSHGHRVYDFTCMGRRIKEVRKSLGYSGEQLAEELNISAVYLRQIESGTADKQPSLSLIVLICNTLQVSPDYLLQDLLEKNELSSIRELESLWKYLSPSRQKLVAAMIEAAIKCTDEG